MESTASFIYLGAVVLNRCSKPINPCFALLRRKSEVFQVTEGFYALYASRIPLPEREIYRRTRSGCPKPPCHSEPRRGEESHPGYEEILL